MTFIKILGVLTSFLLPNISVGQEQFKDNVDLSSVYTVKGNLTEYNHGWVYLRRLKTINHPERIDSTAAINGAFSFTGKVNGIEEFLLGVQLKNVKGELQLSKVFKGPLILSPGVLNIQGGFDWRFPLVAHGTSPQEEYNYFKLKLDPMYSKMNQLVSKKYSSSKLTVTQRNQLESDYAKTLYNIEVAIKQQIEENPNALLSAYIGQSDLKKANPILVDSLYEILATKVKNSTYGRAFHQLLMSIGGTAIGNKAPLFKLSNSSGIMTSLNELKGKFTLIDFWASWCGPCRLEHPNLLEIYTKYRRMGFEIISISMDKNKESWLKAIKEDKLIWAQLSDLKAMESEVGKLYGVKVLPMNVLIDADGTIVARNLNSAQLKTALQQRF